MKIQSDFEARILYYYTQWMVLTYNKSGSEFGFMMRRDTQ